MSFGTEIVREGWRFALVEGAEVLSPREAAFQLAAYLRELDERGRRDLTWLVDRGADDRRDPVELLIQAVEDGRFSLVSLGPARPAALPFPAEDLVELSEPEPLPEPEPEPEPEPSTFVEFRLIDEDDEPLAERPFVLHLADGRSVEGTTDPDGSFRVDEVAAHGECVVEFLPHEAA